MGYKVTVENVAKGFIFLVILILAGRGIYDSLRYSGLSPVCCYVSEADALRGAEGFINNGFLSSAGLPDVCYGEQFPGIGLTWEKFLLKSIRQTKRIGSDADLVLLESERKPKGECIYTHYPPGPQWILVPLTKICGVGNLSCLRLFPTIIAIFSIALFARLLVSALGYVKSAIMMLAIAIIPMTSNLMHGLHYNSYAFSLLLIQFGLLLNIFKKRNFLKIHTNFFILFILGFFQGWLSFDHFFLVSLCALPFALLFSPLEQKEGKKLFFLTILAPTSGFFFAHLLHFIQGWVYLGGFQNAYKDMVTAAAWRFDDSTGSADFFKGRIILVLQYLFIHARAYKFFVINLPVLLAGVCVLIWIKDARINIHRPLEVILKWTSSRYKFYAVLAAFFVSFMWIIVMKQHAYFHTEYIPRHLFTLYFICILTVLECISSEKLNNQNP